LCAISSCFAPTINSVTPLNCNGNWQSEYTITYNSASANSTYTVIEYGLDENFIEQTATHIYTNSSPSILPLNFYDDYGSGVDPGTLMYFRAYNSCSNGATSGYSNVVTATCGEVNPPSVWNFGYITVKNNTGIKLQVYHPNSSQTQAFVNLVEPYLRDVQGRRGITDFRVVCDESNNTPNVIDANQFVGDIYIKPARSVNFIQLNFVAVRTGVSFEEIVGRF